jgi:hypothetical protein
MSEAITKALDEAAGRVGASLGKDAAKAITDLYRDSSGKLSGVIKKSVETDALHAGELKKVADEIEHNAMKDGTSAADRAAANDALRSKLKNLLDDPGKNPPLIKREDDDFSDPLNSKGVGKAHLNADGDLEPANPLGKNSKGQDVSILKHVIGNKDKDSKGNSPYTSFSPKEGSAKPYGSHEYNVDYKKMQDDIDTGKLTGVELHDPASVQNNIRGEIDKIAGDHYDMPTGQLDGNQRQAFIDHVQAQRAAAGLPKLGKAKVGALGDAVMALSNTRRDSEWLVKGTIPKEYLIPVR